jgi:hypothetical protein
MLSRETLKGASLVLFGMVLAACASRMMPTTDARAAGTKVCDYTYITDTGEPEIGSKGRIKYDEDWSSVVNSGWKFVGSSVPGVYMFERCSP